MKVQIVILVITVRAVEQCFSESHNDFEDRKETLTPEGPIETDKCPKDEDPVNPTVLPYPNDCTKFYKCLYGKAYPILCPNGLHFGVEINRCDWPEVAKCDPNVKVPSTPIPTPSTPAQSTPPTSTTEGPIKHPLCPPDEDPMEATVLPYPGDCSKFYKCLYGQAHPISCVPGLHWSVALNRCDWPEVAGCDPNIKVPSTTKAPSSSTTASSSTASTDGPKKHPLCPVDEDPKNPTLIPYPGDCSKFYKCLNGYAHPVSCPSGLHWGVALNRCDWPEVAKCTPSAQSTLEIVEFDSSVGTTVEPPVKHPDCPKYEDPKHTTFIPYPNDCMKFYKCKNGFAIPMHCPSGLHWNTRLSRCDWPESAACDPNIKTTESPEPTTEGVTSPTLAPPIRHNNCPVDEDPATPTYLPVPGDCSKFYRCLHGFAHLTACPSELHWSVKQNRCDWPERAGCDPNIKTTTEGPKESTTAGTTEAPVKHNSCPIKDDPETPVYLPYPNNCAKFYKCNNGFSHAATCPSGLHWSSKENRCDWPEAAKCNPQSN